MSTTQSQNTAESPIENVEKDKPTAKIQEMGDTPMGALVFLSAEELVKCGIDPEEADGVVPSFEDGELVLDAV